MMMDVVKFTNDSKNQDKEKSVYIWKYNLTRHLKYECGTQKNLNVGYATRNFLISRVV